MTRGGLAATLCLLAGSAAAQTVLYPPSATVPPIPSPVIPMPAQPVIPMPAQPVIPMPAQPVIPMPAPPAATPSAAAPGAAPADWQSRDTAQLQALDKVDNREATLNVRVGQSVQFGRLAIAVRACDVRPPDQAQDAAAWLDITDPSPGAPAFHGWMLAAEPFVSMLEHPVYDVRVLGCR